MFTYRLNITEIRYLNIFILHFKVLNLVIPRYDFTQNKPGILF